jgi:hypothetical protein
MGDVVDSDVADGDIVDGDIVESDVVFLWFGRNSPPELRYTLPHSALLLPLSPWQSQQNS